MSACVWFCCSVGGVSVHTSFVCVHVGGRDDLSLQTGISNRTGRNKSTSFQKGAIQLKLKGFFLKFSAVSLKSSLALK